MRSRIAHPDCDGLAHALFEGEAEGAVASIAAFVSQLLSSERAQVSYSLAIEANEMIDAQIVDVGIISSTLTGEILTEIETVGTNGLGKLGNGQVVL